MCVTTFDKNLKIIVFKELSWCPRGRHWADIRVHAWAVPCRLLLFASCPLSHLNGAEWVRAAWPEFHRTWNQFLISDLEGAALRQLADSSRHLMLSISSMNGSLIARGSVCELSYEIAQLSKIRAPPLVTSDLGKFFHFPVPQFCQW